MHLESKGGGGGHFLKIKVNILLSLIISGIGENTNKKHSGTRSLCNVAPTLWNSLPDTLQNTEDIA